MLGEMLQEKERLKTRFGSVLIVPLILVALAVTALAAIGLWSATRQSDRISVARQTREVELALGTAQDDLAQSQTGVAIWNLALVELRRSPPDWAWFDNNVGIYLNYVSAHNVDFILDDRDRPVYGMVSGHRVAPSRFGFFASAMAPLIDAVRDRTRVRPNPHERLPNRLPNPLATARTSPKAIHATDLISIGGRPAVASVMRMIPDTKAVPDTPGFEPLIVSIRYLDAAFGRDLSRTKLIAAARIAASPAVKAGERALLLRSSRGQRLGYLVWRPDLPGSSIFASMAPTAAVAVGLLVLALALLTARLSKVMRRNAYALTLLRKAHEDLKTEEVHAQHRALHDGLTGLANRALFNDALEAALTSHHGPPAAIMLLDLDRFKQVNDTLGHQAGDILIQQVAERLQNAIEYGDLVARLGGDEFGLIVRAGASESELKRLARDIMRAVRKPFLISGSKAFVGISIGIAACDGTRGRSDLMRRADLAMYRAKAAGRGGFCFFTIDLEDRALLRDMLERDLRDAVLARDQLFVEYQPRVAAADRRVVGFEALLRWQHPARGLISPKDFIPIAEETGLVEELGLWVLERACIVAREWPALSFAVNLSPVQLRNPAFLKQIRALIRETGARPEQIELEITEGILLDDDELSTATLAQLRRLGFRVALDDFGTGYSSLNYLSKFEVDKIKIDRSFIQRLADSCDAPAIVCAVVSLGKAMGLVVSAEGVETARQSDFLAAAGCDELQGFFFAAGMREHQLPAYLNAPECTTHRRALETADADG